MSKRQRTGDGSMDELRLRSRQDYLAKREAEKLALLRRQIAEEEEEERTNGNLTKSELREFARNRETLRLAEERLNIDDRNEGYILPDADYSNKSEVLNRRHNDDKYVTEVQQWENEQSAKAKSAQIHGSKGGKVQEQDYDYVFDHAQAINFVTDSKLVDPEKQALQTKLDEAEKKALSIEEARKSLPIYQFKEQILAAFAEHQILIFVAETGSGKTTQLPQYLYEYFQSIGDEGAVACSQPRRVAAMSVAQRVAEEAGTRLGDVVGYQVRFESKVSDKSKLVYMTDGLLLRMFQSNPLLEGYSAIMIDEAHERTVSTDIIMAMLKDVARFRPDLKLLISSATMDAQKFQRYFDDCPVFNVPGRTHPITTYHTPAPEANYLSAAVTTVFQIHLSQGPGDILVFLTGQDEIEAAQQSLEETAKKLGSRAPPLIVAPCYSALPADEQMKIFVPTPPGSRKVVLATNIAETSLTIDGIVYVIDVGMVKEDVYNPRTGMQSLVVNPCSRAQAQQRSGRAGRTGPGKCFRLYTRHAWLSELPESTAPEILRTNLTQTVLLLKSMGINDIINFDFLDAPSPDALIQSLTFLYAIGCLNQEGKLTKLGRRIAEFPTEVTLAKAICSAEEYGCVEEILTIVAMLGESGALHLRPRNKRLEADAARKRFYSKEGGDHIALLTIYNSFAESGYDSIWARENFLQYRSLNRARNVREQLEKLCDRVEVQHSSCGASDHIAIRKALTAGFFVNAARLQRDGQSYRCVKTGITTHIHPSSGMMDAKPNLPKWVIYYELVLTSKEWIRTVMPIEAEWLVEVAPHYHKREDLDKLGVDKKMPKEKAKALVGGSLPAAAARS